MSAYYNEHDPNAAAWLRELIRQGAIADGVVDERSIEDVTPNDLRGFTQCHFFAGIGGWSLALRLAGWADERPVWSGSCPCQPFSAAGKGTGFADERHLWPAWFHLIRVCRPGVVFGEQVEAAINHGWLDLVFDDLEGEGYRAASCGLPASSVGAPHIRKRLWFVADCAGIGRQRGRTGKAGHELRQIERPERLRDAGELAHGSGAGLEGQFRPGNMELQRSARAMRPTGQGCLSGQLDYPASSRHVGPISGAEGEARDQARLRVSGEGGGFSPWSELEWLPCRDGKARPTQPGLFPLAHGVSARVGRLRGYGNAIVPQVAAEVIGAYLSC